MRPPSSQDESQPAPTEPQNVNRADEPAVGMEISSTQDDVEPKTSDEKDELIEHLTRQRDELKDQVLRALAEAQNVRRRSIQEREDWRRFANESLVVSLLPVLDNFERALASMEAGANIESIADGIRAVERQLRSALEGVGLKRIESLGASFDPELHDALVTEETEDQAEGTILAEIEPGYKMAGKVVRPSRVKVAKKP